jgi:predicted amidohydrolase YtcJ
VFEENAQSIIESKYQEYLTTLTAQQIENKWHQGVVLAQEECLRKGITSFQDAGSSLVEIEKFRINAEAGAMDIRLWMMIRHTSEFLKGKLGSFPIIDAGDGFFTCRAIKVSIDGALGSYGAWMLDSYSDKPGFTGQNTTSLTELGLLADLSAVHDLQLCAHAIGDKANREVLNLFQNKYVQYKLGPDARWRIEHAQHLNAEDIPRFAEIGVIASMQGIHCTSDAPFVEKRLGERRAREGAYVWRRLLENHAVVTNGTDAPVEDVDPIPSFYATVTRKRADSGLEFYPEQRLSRAEALYSYTLANAYAAFEENTKGSLVPGKYADIVLLS